MHSFVDSEQEHIAGTEIAGELTSATDEAQVGVYVNDALESKMNYYLDYEADAVARSCSGYAQEVAGSIRLTNAVPPEGSTCRRRSRGSSPAAGSSRRSSRVSSGSPSS